MDTEVSVTPKTAVCDGGPVEGMSSQSHGQCVGSRSGLSSMWLFLAQARRSVFLKFSCLSHLSLTTVSSLSSQPLGFIFR